MLCELQFMGSYEIQEVEILQDENKFPSHTSYDISHYLTLARCVTLFNLILS